jgi:biopolymer transport protein ExbD
MKNIDIEDDGDVEVQMGPLIDCVFLLLIFFMVVALTKKSQRELQMESVPQAISAKVENATETPGFAVMLEPKGLFSVTGLDRPVGFAEMVKALRERAKAVPDGAVWIEYRSGTHLGSLMPVLDACKAEGIGKFAFRLRM